MSSVLLGLLKCRLGMGYKENSQDLRQKQSLNSLRNVCVLCDAEFQVVGDEVSLSLLSLMRSRLLDSETHRLSPAMCYRIL